MAACSRSGKQSRKQGGVAYTPEAMLDAVLLSDRLIVKDDIEHVAAETLVLLVGKQEL